MAQQQRVWPPIYKLLLGLTILLVMGSVALQMFVIAPLREEYDEALYEQDRARSKVKSSEWDATESGLANATKLYSLAIGTHRDPGTQLWSNALLATATKRLQSRMDQVKQASRNTFIGFDGKKTYSDKYDDVKKHLKEGSGQGKAFAVDLIPAVFGMGRASEGNYYNMTLKLLLTEDVVDLLRKHRLQVVRTDALHQPETDQIFLDVRDREAMRKIHASELTVLPVRSYALKKGEPPFLLEVSLRVKVRGTMGDFAAFAADLHGEGRAFAMTNLELQTVKPVMKYGRHGQCQLIPAQETAKAVKIEDVVAWFTCSGFAYPETDLSKPVVRKRTRRHRGGEAVASEKPLGI